MITDTAEYALRAAICLAHEGDATITSQIIAQKAQIPSGYVPKILRLLVRAHIVESRRGPHGGFSLAQPAVEITMLQVINAINPLKRTKKCPNVPGDDQTQLCQLYRHINQTVRMTELAFDSVTIADLLAPIEQDPPYCTLAERSYASLD